MKTNPIQIRAADLFCGAGGTSTGLAQACKSLRKPVSLVAVNHWATAVESHRRNHPWATHHCMDLGSMDAHPTKLVPGGELDILCGSAECTQHSQARGSSVCTNQQSRASGWHIIHWAEQLRINSLLIENVKEFRKWGPTDKKGKPIKSRQGETYKAFLNALESLGFHVDERILCAADYGDATTRERLFIQARKSKRPSWPKLSHKGKWRAAAEIIDWNLRGKSIFNRPKALSPNTIERIKAGLKKFGGEAFLVLFQGTSERQLQVTAHSIHEPLATIYGSGAHQALCEPFLIKYHGGRPRTHSVDEPLRTADTQNRFALCEPFIVQCNHGVDKRSAKAATRAQSVNGPLRTITGYNTHALVEPFVIGQQSCSAPRHVSKPLPTIATAGAIQLCTPYFIKYYKSGKSVASIDNPLPTATVKARFALVEPTKGGEYGMDILLRMLQPGELADAMGLEDYDLAGNKEDQVKQIGNAVPVRTARAICRELLK